MNRIIKFRGKDDTGKWRYGNLAIRHKVINKILYKKYFITDIKGIDFWEVDPKTVGQFTGLCDRNGKEICEGDIIKTRYIDKFIYETNTGVVTFEYGSFILNGNTVYSYHDYEIFEVIGNIHDNKELITKKIK
jgi:uncharacterized phage protein (TIGR01671 family)